jgi:hypothetical protein
VTEVAVLFVAGCLLYAHPTPNTQGIFALVLAVAVLLNARDALIYLLNPSRNTKD